MVFCQREIQTLGFTCYINLWCRKKMLEVAKQMNLSGIAERRSWRVENHGKSGGHIEISAWDFGGTGEIAYLQHANGLCGALWALVATRLKARFRVIAVDCRGHGDSQGLVVPDDYGWDVMVDDVRRVTSELLQETGKEQIALGVGSSFGGILLAGAEARSPDLFRRLVMLDPPIHPSPELLAEMGVDFTPPASTREGLVEQTLKRKYVWESRAAAGTAWREKPLFAPWQDAAFDLYLNEGMRDRKDGQVELKCHPTVEAHIFATTGSLGLFDYAPQVQIPVELVHAEQGFFDYAFYQHIAAVFPNCNLSQMPAGHMLPLEIPDIVAEFLLDSA
jgi:pimeloyl-ACP methyl ester carboxylesterase